MHTSISDFGPVQRMLYRVVAHAGGALAWDEAIKRMGGRSERVIINTADRANAIHGLTFTCDAWGVRVVRALFDPRAQQEV